MGPVDIIFSPISSGIGSCIDIGVLIICGGVAVNRQCHNLTMDIYIFNRQFSKTWVSDIHGQSGDSQMLVHQRHLRHLCM